MRGAAAPAVPMSDESERLRRLRPVLEARSGLLGAARRFFGERGFLEVETPVRVRAPAPESHIDAEPAAGAFLRTSPELHMKRLLAAGFERIFQLGPCFRRGERGDLHHPECALLEWYRAGADYLDILDDAQALVPYLARETRGGAPVRFRGEPIDLDPPWERIAVAEAFRVFAGWDPVAAVAADRFDLDLVDKVEPRLPRGRPVVLIDYPAAAGALARRKAGRPQVAERWELYIGGIEIANAYSELTDRAEQAARFADCAADRRARGKPVYPVDAAFLDALDRMPPAGGIALGVDRLLMVFAGAASLDDVLPFRDEAADEPREGAVPPPPTP